jgi:hypothetical protein
MHDALAGILFSSVSKPSFQASQADPDFMHNASFEDDVFSLEEESLVHDRQKDEDEVDDMIKAGKMDYDHISADASHAETVLTPRERKDNANAASSTAGDLAYQVERKAGFHTSTPCPPAPYPPLVLGTPVVPVPPAPCPPAPYPPFVFGMHAAQVPPQVIYHVQPAPVFYHVQTTNVNVQLNSTNNAVNQNTNVSNTLNHNTINHVEQVNVSNVRNTMNQMNYGDAKPPTASKAVYRPIDELVAANTSVPASSPSCKKSDIRFCPRDGDDREFPKNSKSNVGKMKKVWKIHTFMKCMRKKQNALVARRHKQPCIDGQQQAPPSRRIRSEQAEDGQSKYSKVDDTTHPV